MPPSKGMGLGIGKGKPLGSSTPGPINTVAPALSNAGIGELGDTLTCTTGTWTTNGTISDYAYSWRRDGTTFGAADQNTYDLVEADDDAVMSCVVTATDEFGSRSRSSNALGPYDLVEDPVGFSYLRPGGVDTYYRPGGADIYLRP